MAGMPRMIVSSSEFSDLYYRDHFEELMGFGLDTLDSVEDVKVRVDNNNKYDYETPEHGRSGALNREVYRDVGVRSGRHLFFD